MNSSTKTSVQRHWQLKEKESQQGIVVEFVSPDNFTFSMSRSNVVRLLSKLSWESQITLPDQTRIEVMTNGDIWLTDYDKWTNPNFEFNQVIGTVKDLAESIRGYLTEVLWKK